MRKYTWNKIGDELQTQGGKYRATVTKDKYITARMFCDDNFIYEETFLPLKDTQSALEEVKDFCEMRINREMELDDMMKLCFDACRRDSQHPPQKEEDERQIPMSTLETHLKDLLSPELSEAIIQQIKIKLS